MIKLKKSFSLIDTLIFIAIMTFVILLISKTLLERQLSIGYQHDNNRLQFAIQQFEINLKRHPQLVANELCNQSQYYPQILSNFKNKKYVHSISYSCQSFEDGSFHLINIVFSQPSQQNRHSDTSVSMDYMIKTNGQNPAIVF